MDPLIGHGLIRTPNVGEFFACTAFDYSQVNFYKDFGDF